MTVERCFQPVSRVCIAKLTWNELEASFYETRTGSTVLRSRIHSLREEEENNLPQMKKLFFLYVWLNLTRILPVFKEDLRKHIGKRTIQTGRLFFSSSLKVMTVCPAAIGNTPFKTIGDMQGVKTFNGMITTTAEEVARDVWRGFNKGKTYIITGRKARILYKIQWLIPAWIERYLIRKESERG